jgi:hypothetical protein
MRRQEAIGDNAEGENVHQAFVRAGDRLELLEALDFTDKCLRQEMRLLPDDFDGPQRANDVAAQPDLAIGTGGNWAQQFVIDHTG